MDSRSNRTWTANVAALFVCVSLACAAHAALLPYKSISVEPPIPVMYGPLASQQLVVNGLRSDGTQVDLTQAAKFLVEGPRLVAVDSTGMVRPLADGITQLTISVHDMKTTVPVVVNGSKDPPPHDFQTLVQPILSRYGCNNSNCHGAPTGQAGFKLSLFGYEPNLDYKAVVEAENGRRINIPDPARSLLLLKPTAQVNHGGKERFEVGSDPYRSILEWVSLGANWSEDRDSFLTALSVSPTDRKLYLGDRNKEPERHQQVLVTAWKSDGSLQDVTRNVRYISSNDTVAEVSPEGVMTLHAPGDVAIIARYLGKIGVARLVVVAGEPLPPSSYPPANNFVDEKVFAKLAQLRTRTSNLADDYSFLRRVYLDVTGQIPRRSDIVEFMGDTRSDRRSRLIDRLLDSSDYVEYWTMKWADWLRNNIRSTQPQGMEAFNKWIAERVESNKPYDAMVRELLTESGQSYNVGPVNYYRIATDPLDLASSTSQLFTGVRLECARCHNHPFEKWTRNDYYSFAAFFTEVRSRRVEDEKDKDSQNYEIFDGQGGLRNPATGGIAPPRFLDGNRADGRGNGRPLRQTLADWLTSRDNPYFSQALVNRIWGELFGKGIIDPVDDVRSTNPPSNPELLAALAKGFVENKFDIKWVLRTILNSRTYQTASVPGASAATDTRNFSHHYPRRLSAQQLLDAINTATGIPDYFPGMTGAYRASELPGPHVYSYFLDIFGRCSRVTVGERPSGGSMVQALELINGQSTNGKLYQPGSTLRRLLQEGLSDGEVITELYLTTLCRKPTRDELNRSEMHVLDSRTRQEGFEDLLWVLLNSKEFMNIL